MESVKFCTICGKTKDFEEFFSKHTMCKECYNQKRRNKYKEKNQDNIQLSYKLSSGTNAGDLFFERILQLQQFTFTKGVKDVDGLQDKLDELQDILDKIKENSDVLVFKVKVSSKLNDFLKRTYNNGFDLSGSWNMLCSIISAMLNKHDMDIENTIIHFEEVYDINPLLLYSAVRDEFKNLYYIVTSIGNIYLHMIDYYNDTYQGDVRNKKRATSNMLRTTFNPTECQIVVNNPLRYDRENFIRIFKIVTTPSSHNLGLHGLIEAKYPEKFLEILVHDQ
jgi:hypothetical protein